MQRASKLIKRARNREFRYLFKRIFPQDNLIFFAGRQLIFGMGNPERFREIFQRVASRLDHEVIHATGEHKRHLLDSFPEDAHKFKRRFDRGANCYLVICDGEIVAYGWIQKLASAYDTNSLWRFTPDPPGGYWCYDVFVKPEYRIKGVFVYLSGTVEAIYNQADSRPMFGETSYNNHKSIQAHLSLGYRKIRTVDFVSILGLRLYTIYNHESGKRSFATRFELDPKSHRL